MKRLVRTALGISAALAFGSAAQVQAQVRPLPPTASPTGPPPGGHLTPPDLTSRGGTAPNLPPGYLTDRPPGTATRSSGAAPSEPRSGTTSEPVAGTSTAPMEVTPPPAGVETPPDGGGGCEDRDANVLNDPDDCTNDDRGNASAANMSEPAAPGWRPSWWMIALGLGACVLLFAWISDTVRRR